MDYGPNTLTLKGNTMKKIMLLLLLSVSTIASAETIWILHAAKPGGNSSKMNYALASELEKMDIKLNTSLSMVVEE